MADTLSSDNSVLDSDLLLDRLAEAYSLGARAISFTGGGEPLTHKAFVDISDRCNDIGFDLGLITNGSLLLSSKLEAVVDNYQWLRISMGGPTPTTYHNVQGKMISSVY